MVRFVLTAVVLAGAVFTAAPEARASEPSVTPLSDDIDDDDDDDDDDGFVHRWAPLTSDDNLHPAADDVSTLFFVGSVLPMGSVWLPLVFSDVETPLGYLLAAPLTVVLHALPHVACAATFPCAVGLTFTGIGAPALLVGIVLQLVNVGACVANLHYLMPVALLNDYNRALGERDVDADLSTSRRESGPDQMRQAQAY